MANWQAIVGGVTYNLSDRNPFDVVSVTGVGIAPARRLTQRGPMQHGETDIGFRLDPRNVNLVLAVKAASRAAADAARDTLTAIFKPRGSTPVQLRCTRDDGAVRQLDCYTVGLVDMPITDDERIGSFQRVGVQLVASDPIWYSLDGTTQTVGMSGAWYLAGGYIDAGAVLAYDEDISDVTEWSSASALDEPVFSVFTKTARVGQSNSNWVLGDGGDDSLLAFKWNNGEVQIEAAPFGDDPTIIVSDPDVIYGAEEVVIVTVDASRGTRLYRGSELRDTGVMPENVVVPNSSNDTSGIWKSYQDSTVAFSSAYKIALTQQQIDALIFSVGDPPAGTGYGFFFNSGEMDTFPIITIRGPITNPEVTNETSGMTLEFSATLGMDDYLFIDTRYGHKTIVDLTGTNQIASLSPESDLATFCLIPGVNRIAVSGTGETYTATTSLAWQNRYMGL